MVPCSQWTDIEYEDPVGRTKSALLCSSLSHFPLEINCLSLSSIYKERVCYTVWFLAGLQSTALRRALEVKKVKLMLGLISHRVVSSKLNQTYRFGIIHKNPTVCYIGRIPGETAQEQSHALLEGRLLYYETRKSFWNCWRTKTPCMNATIYKPQESYL